MLNLQESHTTAQLSPIFHKLARHVKSPAPLAITAATVTANKDMALPL